MLLYPVQLHPLCDCLWIQTLQDLDRQFEYMMSDVKKDAAPMLRAQFSTVLCMNHLLLRFRIRDSLQIFHQRLKTKNSASERKSHNLRLDIT